MGSNWVISDDGVGMNLGQNRPDQRHRKSWPYQHERKGRTHRGELFDRVHSWSRYDYPSFLAD